MIYISAAHSFILDVDDELIKQHFTKAELQEIDDLHGLHVPSLSQEVIEYLNKFKDKVGYSYFVDMYSMY